MPYVKKLKIKGKEYWYLFHTVRDGKKFLKRSKYLGKTLPKNIEQVKQEFLQQIKQPKIKDKTTILIESLTPLERKVLPILKTTRELGQITEKTKLKEIEVMRALQWLQNKNILKIKTELKEIITLDKNGISVLKKGLPEKRFLKLLPAAIEQLKDKLTKDEFNVSIGVLKQKQAIKLGKQITITQKGRQILKQETPEEKFLKQLPKVKDKQLLEQLLKRNLVKTELKKIRTIQLTKLGQELTSKNLKINLIETLTPEILAKAKWKNKTFRRYDIQSIVPEIYSGKKQHYRKFLDQVRNKFISLGFQEMDGPFVESDFWDMDALFMPQFHSARDIHQAYYIKEPEYSKLNEKIVEKVKQAHESGFNTGSKGWQYKFDVKRTHRNLLRTQGTACSARMLASKDLKIPGKYFGITRCFRYDVIDATHLPDFNQIEGIVIEKNLNINHLFGLLKMFAKEFAETDEIKIVPGYFPFTEPSAELFAKHPKLGWIELGGAGIFRPEVVKPLLGKEISVLAWGLGIDRLGMFKLGIKDIRKLFSHDLKFLRSAKIL